MDKGLPHPRPGRRLGPPPALGVVRLGCLLASLLTGCVGAAPKATTSVSPEDSGLHSLGPLTFPPEWLPSPSASATPDDTELAAMLPSSLSGHPLESAAGRGTELPEGGSNCGVFCPGDLQKLAAL